MKTFYVTCTRIYNGVLKVEAESESEALEYAKEHLEQVEFEYCETTADYAEEAED
jgi:hypothetical protein